MISACAVGSESEILRFHPRPTILPSLSTTEPTGTSPISRARCAQRRASSIQSSSEAACSHGASVPKESRGVCCDTNGKSHPIVAFRVHRMTNDGSAIRQIRLSTVRTTSGTTAWTTAGTSTRAIGYAISTTVMAARAHALLDRFAKWAFMASTCDRVRRAGRKSSGILAHRIQLLLGRPRHQWYATGVWGCQICSAKFSSSICCKVCV
jgi:hypothetical protein